MHPQILNFTNFMIVRLVRTRNRVLACYFKVLEVSLVMTHNAILWYQAKEKAQNDRESLLERMRSNRAQESELYRHNYNTEAETIRNNQAREDQARRELRESSRHNRRHEAVEERTSSESGRHNRATEGFQRLELDERVRSNKAREREQTRSNRAAEFDRADRRTIERQRLDQDRWAKSQEHDLGREVNRERHRSNVARETLDVLKHNLAVGQQAEVARHNRFQRRKDAANYQMEQDKRVDKFFQTGINAISNVVPTLGRLATATRVPSRKLISPNGLYFDIDYNNRKGK